MLSRLWRVGEIQGVSFGHGLLYGSEQLNLVATNKNHTQVSLFGRTGTAARWARINHTVICPAFARRGRTGS